MEYTLFDTHCHVQFPQFSADRDEVIRRALDKGIGMICVGTDLETSRSAISLADAYDGLYASVGLHPNDALDLSYSASDYEELLSHPKVVSVGEIGLDYYRTKATDLQNRQLSRFRLQLQSASQFGLPVIIHCRDAHDDMYRTLSELGANVEDSNNRSQRKGIIHSFTGTWQQAQRYIDLGYMIGLNGIITFARNYDETVLKISTEHLVFETDAPFLTPTPYRGKRNEPLYITEVVKKMAELRNIAVDELKKVTTENVLTMFRKVYR